MELSQRPLRIVEGPAGERPSEATPAFQLDAVRSVRLHPKLAALVACTVLVLVTGYALTRKPMYEARTLSYVEPLETKVVSDGTQGIYDPARYDSYFQQQIQTATRQDILVAAIGKMPEGIWQQPGEDVRTAADRLAGALKVERVGSSYQLAISLMGDDPERTTAIVNAATNAYLEQGRKDENARSDGRLVLLQEESQRIQKELNQDREEQADLSKILGVADTQTSVANPYDQQLAGVRTELVAAREAHDVAAAQLSSVTASGALSSAGLKAIADEAIASDSGLSALKTTINDRRAVLNAQMATLTPTNPVYKQDADEIASMDKQVEARMTQLRENAAHRVQDKLRLELQRTGDVESRLNGELAHATALAGSAAPKLQRAKDLAADITRLQARYATVDDALRGLQLESSGPGTAHLLVAAQVPDAPAANHRLLLLALALPLAAFAGLLAAVLARKFDKRLYSAVDLEQAVGVTPISVVPVSAGYYEAAQDEHLLRLATGLERGHRLNGARIFVFTAASSGMDVSGLVQSVQAKLGELGFKAVVLDATDVRQTTADQRREGNGASQIEQLKRENAFVLIDARPLLHSADSEYVASCADATLVAAEAGLTTGAELKRCMLLLQQLKATGVGTILMKNSAVEDEVPVRRQVEVRNKVERNVEIVEQRPKQPERERARGFAAREVPRHVSREASREVISVVPKWQDDDEPVFKVTPAKVKPLESVVVPKRVQLVPVAADDLTLKPTAFREEPLMLFEETASGAPVVKTLAAEPIAERAQIAQTAAPPAAQRAVSKNFEEPKVVREVMRPVAAANVEMPVNESAEEKVERMKREAVARVRARFGMPDEAIEALTAAMAKPEPKQEPAPVEEKIFEWQKTPLPVREAPQAPPMREVAAQQPAQQAEPIFKPQPAAALADMPPVRRVTVPQERTKPNTVPVVQWAMQPERRRVPREPIVFPRGLNKAALRMSEKGQAIARGQAGPSLTAAEQAIASKISSAQQPVAAKIVPERGAERADKDGRWSLLRRFGGFEADAQDEPGLNRAAG